jgi:hypothetical protein
MAENLMHFTRCISGNPAPQALGHTRASCGKIRTMYLLRVTGVQPKGVGCTLSTFGKEEIVLGARQFDLFYPFWNEIIQRETFFY